MTLIETLKNYNSYLRKYALIWGTAITIFLTSTYMETHTEPFQRHFTLSNTAISYPFSKSQQFNNFKLALFAVVLPYFTMMLIIFIKSLGVTSKDRSKLIHLAHITTLAFFLSLSLNAICTEFLKLRIGKLRPDFLERCGAPTKTESPFKIYDSSVCTSPYGELTLLDGFKSCPSGHSSFAWCGFNFLNLFLMGQLKLYSNDKFTPTNGIISNNYGKFRLLKLISLIPLAFCLHIALSRSQDYRHDFYDISLGSFIGFTVSSFIYWQFYNSIFSEDCELTKFDDFKLLDNGESAAVLPL